MNLPCGRADYSSARRGRGGGGGAGEGYYANNRGRLAGDAYAEDAH